MIDDRRMDRRLVILRASTARDALGELVETWTELTTVWAEKRDLSLRQALREGEGMAAEEARGATAQTSFRIRWSATAAGIGPKDRCRLDGLTYDITGAREIGRREGIELLCVARADGGGV